MIKKYITTALYSRLVDIILVVGAVMLCVAAQPYGDVYLYGDECYQNLQIRYYAESPMAPLSFYIGHLWSLAFGDNVLAMRHLQVLMYVVAIGIGCGYFYLRTRKRRMTSVLFAMLLLATKFWGMNIYGWDVGCYPFVMMCLVAALHYYHKPAMSSGLLLAVAYMLMTASRGSLGVALPFIVGLVFYCNRHNVRRAVAQLCCGTVLAAAVGVAILYMIYGSPGNFIDVCHIDNVVNGHAGAGLAKRMYMRLYITTMEVVNGWYLSAFALVCAFLIVKARRWNAAIWICSAIVMVMCFVSHVTMSSLYISCGTLQPIFFFVCLYGLYREVMYRDKLSIPFEIWIILLFAFLPMVGSDSFFVRVLVIPTLPVAFAYADRRIWPVVRVATVLLLICVGVGMARQLRVWHTNATCDAGELNTRMAGVMLEPPVVELNGERLRREYLPDA